MQVCKASAFLEFDKLKILEGVKDNYNVLFEDGVIQLKAHEIIMNRFVWDIIVVINKSKYGKEKGVLPMLKRYSITEYYCNGLFASSSLSGLIERIYEDICKFYVEPDFNRMILEEIVYGKIEEVYNDIYNYLVVDGVEYFTSIDVLDFYNIQFQEELIKALEKVAKNKDNDSIMNSYTVLDKVISETPELRGNPIVTGYLSGAFNKRQVYQILSSRGFVSELNSDIIPTPILSSFFLGMSSSFEMAAESRSSAKAQRSAEVAIEQSEYLSRIIQLVSMRFEKLVDGDCQCNDYIDFFVEPDPIIGKPVLPLLYGKWYLDEETGTEKCIEPGDTYLIGKTIKMRSPSKCKHKFADACCVKCFGRIGYSIPYRTNIGHCVAAIVAQHITQSMLGQKHLTGSASGLDFELGPVESEFLFKSNNNGLKLNHSSIVKGKTYELIVKQKDFIGISGGLTAGMNFDKISPNRNSHIDQFIIRVTDDKTGISTYHECSIAFSKSLKKHNSTSSKSKDAVSKSSKVYGYFTSQFIEYIVGKDNNSKNYYLDDGGESYCINLNKWKSKDDIISFPNLEFSFLDLQKDFKRVVRNIGQGEGFYEKLVQNIFDSLNSKLDIPYSIIEILACSFIVTDPVTKDVTLARGVTDLCLKISDIIYNGSIGTLAAFEQHNKHFISPKTFEGFNKGSHVMDVALKPEETVKRYNRVYPMP